MHNLVFVDISLFTKNDLSPAKVKSVKDLPNFDQN